MQRVALKAAINCVYKIDLLSLKVFIIFFMMLSFMRFQVAFHIEPYKGRDEVNMVTNVKYIIEK